MITKIHLRFVVSLALVFALFAAAMPPAARAQTAPQTAPTSVDLQKALQAIEEKTEKRRAELGIPGMSLVIVKDDQVIYMKGLGYKDFDKKIAVTPDTQFAIGSATKAFTALSVLMSQDEGKLSLDDNPKKHLSYFKMYDPETDQKITVRDLLAHSSGLNRTDLAMITGKLSRQELIRVAGEAKPTAKLREKFQYQNIMYTAAGEIVATVQKQPWERFVPERIFKPLGMTNSTMTVAEMQKAKDYSLGYEYNFDTKETRNLPTRDISDVAPAGSINSSARDMGQWLRFVLNGGAINGKRLVSEQSYAEWIKPQQKIAPNGAVNYGLGWFLQEWNGLKVVQHGGNIDGFNSLVAMIPEKKIGFVMLTNVTGSSLGGDLMPVVWSNLLGDSNAPKQDATAVAAPEKEVGKYRLEAAGFDIEVKFENARLTATVPGQPVYELQNVGGRKYKLANAPEGFFITFKDDSAYLEQPQGNYTLPKQQVKVSAAATNPADNPAKELVGQYQAPNGPGTIEIKDVAGKISLVVGSQPPYELKVKDKDVFSAVPLPDSYSLKVRRDAAGKLEGITLVQPEGEFAFKFIGAGEKADLPKISVDELMAKAIEAAGGEANWRKLNSRVTVAEIDLMHQGVKGTATSYAKAPNRSATETTMTAIGKTIAKGYEFFDGTNGEELYTFAPVEKYAGRKLEDIRLGSDFYGLLNWKTNYKTAEIKGTEKVGDEEAYVVEFTPEKGTKVTELYSTKTFLLLKRRGVVPSSTSSNNLPYSITFSDYRDVDGVKLPFKSINTSPSMGDVVTVVTSVKHNAAIDDKMFAPHKVELK